MLPACANEMCIRDSCSSDLHIKHGSVPRAVPGITVGHEMVGIVEEVGSAAVSYTHLDVYKRQVHPRRRGLCGSSR